MKILAKIFQRAFLPLVLALAGLPLGGQVVTRVGLEAGGGLASMGNERFACAPIPSLGGALQVDLGLSSDAQVNRAVALRTGLSLLQRGAAYSLELPSMDYRREGSFQGLCLQLPLLAHVRLELPPVAPYRNHWVTLSLGPALSCAVAGSMEDRQSCGHFPDAPEVNGHHLWQGKEAFLHARRLDLGVVAAAGYQFDRLELEAVLEAGFRPMLPTDEAELFVGVLPGVAPQGYDGYLSSLSLRLGYLLPVKEHLGPRGPENPFEKRRKLLK